MKILSDQEMKKEYGIGRHQLTPTQQERLGRSIRDSIDKLEQSVSRLGSELKGQELDPTLQKLVVAVYDIVKLGAEILAKEHKPPSWRFVVHREGEKVTSIEAHPNGY